jgi:hypothetical protein
LKNWTLVLITKEGILTKQEEEEEGEEDLVSCGDS